MPHGKCNLRGGHLYLWKDPVPWRYNERQILFFPFSTLYWHPDSLLLIHKGSVWNRQKTSMLEAGWIKRRTLGRAHKWRWRDWGSLGEIIPTSLRQVAMGGSLVSQYQRIRVCQGVGKDKFEKGKKPLLSPWTIAYVPAFVPALEDTIWICSNAYFICFSRLSVWLQRITITSFHDEFYNPFLSLLKAWQQLALYRGFCQFFDNNLYLIR